MSRRRALAVFIRWERWYIKVVKAVGNGGDMVPSEGWGRSIRRLFREERRRHKRRSGRMS